LAPKAAEPCFGVTFRPLAALLRNKEAVRCTANFRAASCRWILSSGQQRDLQMRDEPDDETPHTDGWHGIYPGTQPG